MRYPALMLLLLMVVSMTSCTQGPRLQPIRGQVFYKGEPVPGALVAFHPLGPYPTAFPHPIAYTDKEGRFRLTTNKPNDGVALGEYAVTLESRERSPTGNEKIGAKNLLPAHYSKAESSGLRCRVEAGQEEVPAFFLTDP